MTKRTNATMNTTTDTIKFRSKFVKVIEKFSEEKHDRIIKVVVDFKDSSNDAACLKKLWELTFDYIKGLKGVGIISDDATEDEIKEFSEEFTKSFRNELRYQRKNVKHQFMERKIPENCKEAYKALNVATEDAIVAVIVYDACYKLCEYNDEYTIENTLSLLSNDEERYYFGGIRKLYFGRNAAIYLKPYVLEIHNLLKALYEEKSKERKYTPFKNMNDMIRFEEKEKKSDKESNGKRVTFYESIKADEQVEIKDSESIGISIPLAITVSNIEADSKILENFLRSYKKIVEAGYAPEQVIEKSKYIQAILYISKKLIE